MPNQLQALTLVHRHKKAGNAAEINSIPGFYIETCQREFVISNTDFIAPKDIQFFSQLTNTEIFTGTDAYCFLLKIITGLESALLGETEILGQFKSALKNFENKKDTFPIGLYYFLIQTTQKSLEDAKIIRTQHLQRIGNTSYGSLIRRILQDATVENPIFFVGAGKIAHTTLPYFKDHPILLWNRHKERARELILSSKISEHSHVTVLQENEEFLGWKNASHVILCIPAEPKEDQKRIAYWKKLNQTKNASSKIIHLGLQRGDSILWESLPELLTLTDLFDLEKGQNELRRFAVEQAVLACQKKSQHRCLGGHSSLPHGWEDLMSLA